MRSKLFAIVSVVVWGLAGLLSASAQAPVGETYGSFIRALNAHEERMARIQGQFDATLPWAGPFNEYQLELLAQLEAPQPSAIANSSFNCIRSGGGSVMLVTVLDSNHKVLVRSRELKSFSAKTGWKFERPTASNYQGVILFEGSTSTSRKSATADFEDRYSVGQYAPHGQAGSGRYYVACYNNNNQRHTQSWSWRLFRDCPDH